VQDELVALIAERSYRGVRIGATHEGVLAALGEPEDVSAIRAPIWKYGDLEVSFHDGRAVLLCLDARSSETTLPELRRLLDEHSIPHEIDPALTFETQTAIRTATGASIVFDADGTLDSVCIS
jgi:hypothetical protein